MVSIWQMQNSGLLTAQPKTGQLYIDLNNDSLPQPDEIISDLNKDQTIDSNEVLNFIVNNIWYQPVIEKAKTLLKNDTAPASQKENLEFKEALIKRELFQQLDLRLKNLSALGKQDIALSQQINALGVELSLLGYHPYAKDHIYYLPSGGKIIAPLFVEFFPSGKIKTVSFSPEQEVPLPSVSQVKVTRLEFSDTGKLLSAEIPVSMPLSVTLVTSGTFESVKADKVWFDNDLITKLHLAGTTTITLPNNKKYPVQELLCFDQRGQIIEAELAGESTFDLGKDSLKLKGKVLFNNSRSLTGQLTLSGQESQQVSLPNISEKALINGSLILNTQGQIIKLNLTQNLKITLPSGANVTIKDVLSLHDHGALKDITLSEPLTVTLSANDRFVRVAVQGISFNPNGKIQRLLLHEENAEIFTEFSKAKIKVGPELTYNDDGQLIGLSLAAPAKIILPGNYERTVSSIKLDAQGKIAGIILDQPQTISLADGTWEMCTGEVLYNSYGKPFRFTLNDEHVFTLAIGTQINTKGEITLNEQGFPTGLIQLPPEGAIIKLPDGQSRPAVGQLVLDEKGRLLTVSLAEPITLTLPNGQALKIVDLTYAGEKIIDARLLDPVVFNLPNGIKANIISLAYIYAEETFIRLEVAQQPEAVSLGLDLYNFYNILLNAKGAVLEITKQ